MKPTVGRIVHFNRKHGDFIVQEAALVVAVHNEECVTLVVWNAYGTSTTERSISRGGDAGKWD